MILENVKLYLFFNEFFFIRAGTLALSLVDNPFKNFLKQIHVILFERTVRFIPWGSFTRLAQIL